MALASVKEADKHEPLPTMGASFRDVCIAIPSGFILESGERLRSPELRVRLYGDENNPVVIALGGISAGRLVTDTEDCAGWWPHIVKPGGGVDLNQFCVLGVDFLPNPGETLLTLTTIDQARVISIALDALDISRIHSFIGASYGGMVGLAFAARYPERLTNLCIISAADRTYPASTALRGIQRRIIKFARDCGKPEDGLALARELAMTSYRTPEEFADRFSNQAAPRAGEPYEVCRYLMARGTDFAMDTNRFVTLSDSIDRHCIDVTAIKARSLLVCVQSDRLVPPGEMQQMHRRLNNATLLEISSPFGHDAFLKETNVLSPQIKKFLEEKNP